MDRILIGTLLLILLVLIGVQASRATEGSAPAGQEASEPAQAIER
jgi:hypothetical protein